MQRPEWPLLIALAVGLLIGAERERRKGNGETRRSAGVRTFTLVAVLGGVAALIGHGIDVLAGAFVAGGAVIGFARRGPPDRDLTGEVALVVTFMLGVLAHTQPLLAVELGVLVAALLAYRVQIHHLVRDVLTEQELLDGIAFAIAAAVVLPMLPDRTLDSFGLFNPSTFWRLVVGVMALSALGYIAQRIVGVRFGLVVAGLAAGLVSATAAVASMAQRSRADTSLAAASAAGAVASLFSSITYMSVLVFAVSPRLAPLLVPPLAAAAIAMLGYAAILGRRAATQSAGAPATGRAFNFGEALLFVLIVACFTGVSRLLSFYFGDAGVLAGVAAIGLVDAHAAAVSMAALNSSQRINDITATLGVLVGLSTNMLIKAPIAFTLGTRAYALQVATGIALILVSVWVAFGLTALPAGLLRNL